VRTLTRDPCHCLAVWATEGLEVTDEEQDLLILIWRETKTEELEDMVKQAVKALRSTSARSIHSSEWLKARVLYFHGKNYVPLTADIRRKSWHFTTIVTSLDILEGGRPLS